MKVGKPHFLVVSINFLSGCFINKWWHYVTISKRHGHDICSGTVKYTKRYIWQQNCL